MKDYVMTLTSLMNAVDAADVRLIEHLISNGVNPNIVRCSDGYSPIGLAVELGDIRVVECLLNNGADPNLGGLVTTTLDAARSGSVDSLRILMLLLEAGASPHLADEEGETVWTWARYTKNESVLAVLSEFSVGLA